MVVEPVKESLWLSGYFACRQNGGVQIPRAYVEEDVANTDLVLLVTIRPMTRYTLAWARTYERDQWGRAKARHLRFLAPTNSDHFFTAIGTNSRA